MELKIKNLERDSQSGLVQIVHFQLWHEGEYIYGSCELKGDASQPGFIPFEQLSKEQVLQWLEAELDKKPKEEITEPILDEEDKQIGTKVVEVKEGESQLSAMKKQLQSIVEKKKLVQGLPF